MFESAPKAKAKPDVNIPRTIPIYGRTPGKASRQRATERGRFDAAVRERIEEREREKEEVERERREEEEEEYRRRRKETVIWAKPVPGMYGAAARDEVGPT